MVSLPKPSPTICFCLVMNLGIVWNMIPRLCEGRGLRVRGGIVSLIPLDRDFNRRLKHGTMVSFELGGFDFVGGCGVGARANLAGRRLNRRRTEIYQSRKWGDHRPRHRPRLVCRPGEQLAPGQGLGGRSHRGRGRLAPAHGGRIAGYLPKRGLRQPYGPAISNYGGLGLVRGVEKRLVGLGPRLLQ